MPGGLGPPREPPPDGRVQVGIRDEVVAHPDDDFVPPELPEQPIQPLEPEADYVSPEGSVIGADPPLPPPRDTLLPGSQPANARVPPAGV